MKTLFSNIGNRNITYKGFYIDDYLKKENINKKLNFKTYTKKLLDSYEQEEDYIKPLIINTLIDKVKNEIDEVIIFSSDQKNIIRTDQDTFYAGEILANLLKKIYPEISFRNIVLKCSVVEHNQLIRTFRSKYREFKNEKPAKQIIYCDAGGTSQQKFASKIILEYLFNAEDLKVYYVSQEKTGKSTITDGDPHEYRKIIDKEHIFTAIKTFSYKAALSILGGSNLKQQNTVQYKLIDFARMRSDLMYDDARNKAKDLSYTNDCKNLKFITDYSNSTPLGNYKLFNEFINKSDFFIITEILSIAQRNVIYENYSFAVLNFYRFQELYLYSIIKKLGYDLSDNFDNDKNRLNKEARKKFKNVYEKYHGNKFMAGLPLYILVGENLNNKLNRKIIDVFKKTNSQLNDYSGTVWGIDYLRNQFAHKGKTVLKETLITQPYYKELTGLFDIFGLPETNIYETMNSSIKELIA